MNRRQLLVALLSSAATALLGRRAGAGPLDQGIGGTGFAPTDQGIGGTGVAPPTDESDRGIGGTGVIGTIRKFGSIVVNDLRIAYPPDAVVRIDGQSASVSDLRIGQVVRVAANGQEGALSTRTIDVTSEVVGPVEKTGKKELTVLGQRVSTAGLKTSGLKIGDVVAVSGLRRNDGVVAASLIERSPGAASRVAGPLAAGDNGGLRIGGLPVSGVDPSLIGQRVLVEGSQDGSRYVARRAVSEAGLLPPSVRNLSIESYVERRGDNLRLGSGYAVGGGGNIDVPAGRSVHAVLQTTIGADGRLNVDSVRAGGRTYGGTGRGGFGSGRGGSQGGPAGGGRGGPGREGPGGTGGPRGPSGFGGRGSGGSGPGGGPGGATPGGGRSPMDFGRGSGGRSDGPRSGDSGGPGGFDGGGGGGFDRGGGAPGGFGGPGGGPGGFGGPGGGGFGGPGGGGFGGGGFGGPGGGGGRR